MSQLTAMDVASPQGVVSHTPTHDLIRKARRYHLARFWRQFFFWSAMIFLSVICYPLVRWMITSAAGVDCHSAGSCLFNPYALLNTVPVLLLLTFFFNHWIQDYQSGIAWRNAANRVGNLAENSVVAGGIADFFDVYIRSKRRSYHLLAAGLLGLTFATVSAYVIVHAGIAYNIFWVVVVAEFLLGMVLLVMSFRIARWYLPGEIVVRNTLLLCTIALQKDINIPEAHEIVVRDIQEFVERKPWWFFN